MSLCFDIGANIGQWSIQNLAAYNYSKIISIEASPTTFAHLSQIVSVEPRIVPLSYAITSSSDPFIKFYNCESHTLSTLNKKWLTDPSSRFSGSRFTEIEVPTTSIDALIQRFGVPDLIKIDVEGAEFDVIQSLTQKVPLLCFEWASELNDDTFNSLEYLNKIGFHSFFLQFNDNYTFRPPTEKELWSTREEITLLLMNTKPKVHWGMIWAC